MKLDLKREIVCRFIGGDSLMLIVRRVAHSRIKSEDEYLDLLDSGTIEPEVEQALRDYINGKFRLEPKGKRKV